MIKTSLHCRQHHANPLSHSIQLHIKPPIQSPPTNFNLEPNLNGVKLPFFPTFNNFFTALSHNALECCGISHARDSNSPLPSVGIDYMYVAHTCRRICIFTTPARNAPPTISLLVNSYSRRSKQRRFPKCHRVACKSASFVNCRAKREGIGV